MGFLLSSFLWTYVLCLIPLVVLLMLAVGTIALFLGAEPWGPN